MRTFRTELCLGAVVFILHSTSIEARGLDSSGSSAKDAADCSDSAMLTWPDFCPGLWPRCVGVQQTSELRASFNSFGQLGTGYSWCGRDIFGCMVPSFETPPNSHNDYLFSGSVWIGGVVGNDTLVSVGADGWYQSREIYPSNVRTGGASVTKFRPHLGTSLRSEATDTFTAALPGIILDNDWLTGRPHLPLGVRVVLRSYTLDAPPFDQMVIYDLLVTNISGHTIHAGYVGLFFDADVYNRTIDLPPQGYTDDVVGSLKAKRIAYVIDNDGDPVDGAFDAPTCVTRAFAAKILNTSIPFADTNFNWWISNGSPECDFGPRQKADTFDFETGGTGTPVGDRNKYHIMSYPEWDYDEVLTRTIDSTDSIWRYPIPPGPSLCDMASDVRMLLSVGPFELSPDSSILVQFATFTGDSVHQAPDNLGNLAVDPDLYLANLDFEGVVANAARSDTLSESLMIPTTPVSGLMVAYRDRDSVVLTWDPWLFSSEISGYNIYVAEVPDSAFPYPGLMPPWYEPSDYRVHARVGRVSRCRIRGLDPDKFYALNVSTRVGCKSGELGDPVFVPRPNDRPPAPSVTCSTLVSGDLFAYFGQPFTLEFDPPHGSVVSEYRVYKFESVAQALLGRLPYYSCDGTDTLIPLRDSFLVDGDMVYYYALAPYAVVAADVAQFTDTALTEGVTYVVTYIESTGVESEFSVSVSVRIPEPRTRDLLLITEGWKFPDKQFVEPDSITNFYRELLQGYDYDVYKFFDTITQARCSSHTETCFDWRVMSKYKLVIVDDGLYDRILQAATEAHYKQFRRYVGSGGTFVYFGRLDGYIESWIPGMFLPAPYDQAFLSNYLGLDSVAQPSTFAYVGHGPTPGPDTLYGFKWAESMQDQAPEVWYDTTRYPFHPSLKPYWPTNTAPAVAVFRPRANAESIHRFRSIYPAVSLSEGETVGVRYNPFGKENRTYTFGFHLWYMRPVQARELIHWILPPTPTDVSDNNETVPVRFELAQNYPNPFNPSTTISYSLPRKSHVTLEVFNILGQRLRTLVNDDKASGVYRIVWNGDDDAGRKVATGIYLYRLKTDSETISKKMLLLK